MLIACQYQTELVGQNFACSLTKATPIEYIGEYIPLWNIPISGISPFSTPIKLSRLCLLV